MGGPIKSGRSEIRGSELFLKIIAAHGDLKTYWGQGTVRDGPPG